MSKESKIPKRANARNKKVIGIYITGLYLKNKRAIQINETHYAICYEASAYLNELPDNAPLVGDLIENVFYPHVNY